jgi:hypothetical protein
VLKKRENCLKRLDSVQKKGMLLKKEVKGLKKGENEFKFINTPYA